MKKDKHYVFYHNNCSDGFMSATVYSYAFETVYADHEVEYIGLDYGQFTVGIDSDGRPFVEFGRDAKRRCIVLNGCHVAFLDISFSDIHPFVLFDIANFLMNCMEVCKTVKWFDHHEASLPIVKIMSILFGQTQADGSRYTYGIDDLATVNFDNTLMIFDNSRSGARITFDWVYSINTNVSYLGNMALLIDDRDRWVFNYGDTSKYLHSYLSTIPYDITTWAQIGATISNIHDPSSISSCNIFLVGKSLYEAELNLVRIISMNGQNISVTQDDVVFQGTLVNGPGKLASQIGSYITDNNTTPQFVIIWYENKYGKIVCSIRAPKSSDFNCNKLAQRFGGGGHKGAAGCAMNKIEFEELRKELTRGTEEESTRSAKDVGDGSSTKDVRECIQAASNESSSL